MEKIITVQNLRKAYKKETAVENVCFELMPGNIMGLLGTNGAGKTTTLKMITNLCAKDNGQIVIDNISLDTNPELALSKVGAALDTPSFYQELTARENIECFAHLYKNFSDSQVMELLDYVGLHAQSEKKVKNFSLGMKQRLALARAMLGQPKLIILDEPANGLDPQGQINLYRLICEMAQNQKTTFIVSSHQLHDMEKFCTDILILDKGKSILQGKTDEILSETTNMVDCILEEAADVENFLFHLQGISLISHKGNQFTVKLSKILCQPLLHGETRTRIIQSKMNVAVSMSILFILLVAMLNYTTAFIRWGYQIFEIKSVVRTIEKYLLSGIYMSCVTLGIITLCMSTRNAWKTIFSVIVYLLADSFIYDANIPFLQKIWIGYYFHLWTFSYEYQQIPLKEVIVGIFVMLLYGILFYQITLYRTKNIDF